MTLNFNLCNPLEQFHIFAIKSCFTSNFTNALMIHFVVIMLGFYFLNFSILIRNGFHLIFVNCFELMKNSYYKNTSLKTSIYMPIFFFVFMTIFVNNLIGLIPYSYALTSSLIFNFFIMLSLFIMINLIGIIYHKWNFFNIFMPKGLPLTLTWFLIFFETVSYFASVFSLTIRLFANMLSGHILQHMLITFAFQMFLFPIFTPFFMIPFIMTFLVTCLELAISALQAYVLMTLLLMYFGNTINLH